MGKDLIFKLTRPAKSQGGDRYEYGKKGDDDFMTVYVPQSMSRKDGNPFGELSIKITPA
jgi:hypothetical protein